MELYKAIKSDVFIILLVVVLLNIASNVLGINIDSTDKDGWNRSGFELLTDYGTGKEYLYRNGTLIERGGAK